METPIATRAVLRPALSSFVGRRHELGRLRDLLSTSRLITITGPGGVGKTRLAEEFAASLARSPAGAIAVAYLSGASAPPDVVDVVAASVGLANRGTRAVRDELVDYLRERHVLLLLDNCEHVLAAAAEITDELLRACPGVVIVATGRQPLHVPGEQLFPLGGLLPERGSELFADRARLIWPDFVLDELNTPQVKEVCLQLDGMPLAIELAAAQVRSLGLAELGQRLVGHLPELGSRSTVGPERQRTLHQTVDWSHDLLSEDQRVAWRRLSVFSGGFTIEAAERVVEGAPIEPADVAGLLADLVDQSMLVFEPGAGRYRLLEALREYAREQLVGAGEEALIAEKHRRWMVDLAVECDARWFGPEQANVIDRMHAEAGNLRAALENCRDSQATADGLRVASGAVWYWLTRASLEEGLRWFRVFLGRSGDPVLEARASWRAGYLATISLDFAEAREFLERAMECAVAADDPLDAAYARGILGLETLYERPGEAEEARRLCRDMLEDPADDAMARQWGLIGYALASLALGDLGECRRASLEGAAIGRAVDELWGRELSLRFLAHAEWQLGRTDAAEAALVECLQLDRRLADVWHMAWSTEALAWVAVDTRGFERGARLLGIADGLWAQTGTRLADPWQAWHATALERLREHLGARRLNVELGAGRSLSVADALSYALEEAPSSPRPSAAALSPLSERELEVVALVAAGLTNPAIAQRLFLSPRTVAKHVEHVMDKLGVGSRAEIASWHAQRSATVDPTQIT